MCYKKVYIINQINHMNWKKKKVSSSNTKGRCPQPIGRSNQLKKKKTDG